MKQILTLLTILVTLHLCAQPATKYINYQGVLRNSDGSLMTSTAINLRLALMPSTNLSLEVYAEQHSIITNEFGEFNVLIGSGTAEIGVFATDIDFVSEEFYLNVQVNNTDLGDTKIVATAYANAATYALYAEEAANVLWQETPQNDISYSDGDVGIGIPLPNTQLHVHESDNTQACYITVTSGSSGFGTGAAFGVINNDALIVNNDNGSIKFSIDNAEVANLDASGTLTVEHEVNQPATGTANLLPICYGTVATSSIQSGTGNFSVSFNSAANVYNIQILSHNYNHLNYTTLVTPISNNVGSFYTNSTGNLLQIFFKDSSGAGIAADFHFITYFN